MNITAKLVHLNVICFNVNWNLYVLALKSELLMKKNLTQEELAARINKKRSFISKIENDGENITLKTLFDVIERGLGGGD